MAFRSGSRVPSVTRCTSRRGDQTTFARARRTPAAAVARLLPPGMLLSGPDTRVARAPGPGRLASPDADPLGRLRLLQPPGSSCCPTRRSEQRQTAFVGPSSSSFVLVPRARRPRAVAGRSGHPSSPLRSVLLSALLPPVRRVRTRLITRTHLDPEMFAKCDGLPIISVATKRER
jgi:hypothetical protein